jgi:hypothetical protein
MAPRQGAFFLSVFMRVPMMGVIVSVPSVVMGVIVAVM